jgi:hypothetical protein
MLQRIKLSVVGGFITQSRLHSWRRKSNGNMPLVAVGLAIDRGVACMSLRPWLPPMSPAGSAWPPDYGASYRPAVSTPTHNLQPEYSISFRMGLLQE